MIIGIVGKLGQGKTLLATYLVYLMKKRNKNLKIYSNYNLNFKHQKISFNDLLTYKENKELDNAVIVLDEFHIFLDSRGSGANKKNKIITYFITQTRKRNVILIYTTQKLHMVDKRLRDLTDYLIKCEKIDLGNNKFYIKFHILEDNDFNSIKTKLLTNPEKYFSLYDTKEIIDFTKQ